MACDKSVVLQILIILVSIRYVDSTRDAKQFFFPQQELPEWQTEEKMKENAGQEPLVTKEQRTDIDHLLISRIEELESRLDKQDAYNHRVDKEMSVVKSSVNQLVARNKSHRLADYFVQIRTTLTLDDQVVSAAIADTDGLMNMDTGGNVAVLHVSKGQRVQVKGRDGIENIISFDYLGYSTFSGFLLYVV